MAGIPNVLLISLLVTLLFTRAGIIRRYIHTPILRRFNGKYDLLDEGFTCPLCVGFWVTIAGALLAGIGFWQWTLLYLIVVFLMALYDFLNHRNS